MKAKLDHVGIVVSNLEKAMKFYSEMFGWKVPDEPPYNKILEIDVPGERTRYALLKANENTYVELLQPIEGPWLRRLKERGEGAMWELCIEVEDMQKFLKEIEKRGVKPLDRFDQPTDKKYELAPSGAKFLYLPPEKCFGTWIEILERPWRQKDFWG